MFCYTTGTEVPGTRKTTRDRKQTATTATAKTKTKATTEAKRVAEMLTTKTVSTKAAIARATATDKITEDKSLGFYSFIVPFCIIGPILNNRNRYINNNNINNNKNTSIQQRTKSNHNINSFRSN